MADENTAVLEEEQEHEEQTDDISSEYEVDESGEVEIPSDDEPGDSTEEPEAEAAEEPVSESPAIDDELLELASLAGLSREQALAYQNPDLLMNTLEMVLAERNRQQQQVQQQPPAEQEPPVKPFDLKFEEDIIDEQLLGQLTGMNDHFTKSQLDLYGYLSQMNQQLQGVAQWIQQQHEEAFWSRMDNRFAELGEEYQDLYGQGPELSPEQQRSQRALVDQMLVLERGYTQSGKRAPSENELFQMALRLNSADRQEELARKKIASKVSKRAGQAIQKPTNRPSKGRPKNAALDDQLDDIYRQAGISVESESEDEIF